MRNAARILFGCVLPVLLALAGCQHPNGSARSEALAVGLAEIDITPPVGHRMAGYFDERLATGVHDPLKAKAIVIQQRREQIALVFCDLVGLSLNVTTNARARASQLTGIPVSNIVIAATHSHTGPLFDDVRRHYFHQAAIEKFGNDPHEKIYYPAFLTERLVQVITNAQHQLRPAEIEVGIAKQEGLGFNRRYWMRSGKVAFNPGQLNTNIVRPAGPSDPDVGLLLATDAKSRRPFAGLTVFAMHSDTVGGTEYSADYAYFLQQTLRRAWGSNYISAFGAGTCGDINHINVNRKEPVKGLDVAERLGTTLGRTVVDAASRLEPIAYPSLAVRRKFVDISLQDYTPAQLADARSKISRIGDEKTDFFTKVIAVKTLDLAEHPAIYPMEVQVFRFDENTALVCLPCEIFVELGLAIKAASPFKKTIVLSICNDRPSYVPTRKAFAEGSYEVTNSRVKPGSGEMLVDAAEDLLKELKP